MNKENFWNEMYKKYPMATKAVHNINSIEGEIMYFVNAKKTITGYVFYYDETKIQ